MATLTLKNPSARFQMPPAEISGAHKLREQDGTALAWLTSQYPEIFNPHKPKPLAIGTMKQLILAKPAHITGKSLRQVIQKWTQRREYIQAISTGGFRYRLDGIPAGAIADQHRAYALTLLEK